MPTGRTPLIRHLATTYRGNLLAAGEFERRVTIWDVVRRESQASADTDLDFGGTRLAVDPRGRQFAAAAYNRLGLAAYDATTGIVAWRRRDLKQLQFIRYSEDGTQLYCCSDVGSGSVLDAATGAEIARLRGVRHVWESPFAPLLLLDRARPEVATRDGVRLASVERTTFGILDAAFAPNALCLTESGGPLRCLELSGRQRWRYDPPPGTHVLDVDYTARDGAFVGVEWCYETGGAMRLARFDETTGVRQAITEFPPEPTHSFLREATILVTASGRLIDTSSGVSVAALDFARSE